MKNLFKIIVPTVLAIALTSCIATTATDSYGYNDNYSQGYSDGYRDGYYQSPDGYWYAPNAVYLDYNNNYYRNGVVYTSGRRSQNVIISPRRSSLNNQFPSGTRTQQNGTRNQSQSNIRILPNTNSGTRNQSQNNVRIQPNVNSGVRSQSQNNIRVQPNTNSGTRNQSQNNIRVQPQNNPRSESQNNVRVQPQVQPDNNSQRSNGSR